MKLFSQGNLGNLTNSQFPLINPHPQGVGMAPRREVPVPSDDHRELGIEDWSDSPAEQLRRMELSSVVVLEPFDIVFAEIGSTLNFDENKLFGSDVFNAMG